MTLPNRIGYNVPRIKHKEYKPDKNGVFDKLAFFGYNKAEGGELDIRRVKRYIYMDSAEHRLAIVGMNHFRSRLNQTGKPTEAVDALLIKLWKAKVKHRDCRRKP